MALVARTGRTRDGLPLSVNVAPAADLARYVARYYVTIFDQPPGQVIEDSLLNETAMVRLIARGEFAVREREWAPVPGRALLLGAQRRGLRVRLTGSMAIAGLAIRPAAWPAFAAGPASGWTDQVRSLDGAFGTALLTAIEDIDDVAATIARIDAAVRARLAHNSVAIDARMERFEAIARAEPGMTVSAIAELLGTTQRQFDRDVRRHFGHPPKTVLRRGRFLDIAAVMRGLAVPDADELATMRFYDASHLNREFRLFLDQTPGQFRRQPTPLFTPGLEVRQQRKLADVAALSPGLVAPWRAAGIETRPQTVESAG